jgi:multiple sugar transport system permease protein
MSSTTHLDDASAAPPKPKSQAAASFRQRYWPFVLPGTLVICGVIVFPWTFTVWMALHEWKVTGDHAFVGLANFIGLFSDQRFIESIWRTLWFTLLATLIPVVLGVWAALVFHRSFPFRGLLRTIFVMPMMATPVAIALVWTMMFHPQLGVLNYLLSLVGLPPFSWIYDPATVIPTLVLVEVWHWTAPRAGRCSATSRGR